MSRAAKILEQVGKAKKLASPTNPFKHQGRILPGQKVPTYIQRLRRKNKLAKAVSSQVFKKPWHGDDPNQLPQRLLKFQMHVARDTGRTG
jgi:hypothetical protein